MCLDVVPYEQRIKMTRYKRVRAKKHLKKQCTKQHNKCFWCFHIMYGSGNKLATIEHLIPLARGGKNSAGNIVGACRKCNCKRGHKMPTFWEIVVGVTETYKVDILV